MLFTIVIPTCNRNEALSKCLKQLSPSVQTINSLLYEVIVSDDSKDNSGNVFIDANYPWVKWVVGPQSGPSSNRNNGAKFAIGKWIIFTDDDCIPDVNYIMAYKKAIEDNHSIKAYEGKIMGDRLKQSFDDEAPINENGNNFWSCNICIEKKLFQSIHGFDEWYTYPAGEDIDLKMRISRHTDIKFVESALVIHPWRKAVPFKHFWHSIKSQHRLRSKFNADSVLKYRYSRLKIFVGGTIIMFKELKKYSYRGFISYLEKNILNFILIFI